MDAVLGLNLGACSERKPAASTFALAEQLAAARDRARAGKDWQQADELRRRITALGYGVEDTAAGARLIAIKKLPGADGALDPEEF
jgi:cysteinyl-tRNA synthetase